MSQLTRWQIATSVTTAPLPPQRASGLKTNNQKVVGLKMGSRRAARLSTLSHSPLSNLKHLFEMLHVIHSMCKFTIQRKNYGWSPNYNKFHLFYVVLSELWPKKKSTTFGDSSWVVWVQVQGPQKVSTPDLGQSMEVKGEGIFFFWDSYMPCIAVVL